MEEEDCVKGGADGISSARPERDSRNERLRLTSSCAMTESIPMSWGEGQTCSLVNGESDADD